MRFEIENTNNSKVKHFIEKYISKTSFDLKIFM